MQKLFVIGNPIKHSKSPTIHNYWLRKYSINAIYDKKDIENRKLEELILKMRDGEIHGLNVTIPFKRVIVNYIDQIEESAEKSMAVNTVYKLGSKIIGANTDGIGFFSTLKNDFSFRLKPSANVFCLGAGGAAYGIISELLNYKPKKIIISNRTKKSSHFLFQHFEKFLDYKEQIEICEWGTNPEKSVDLLVNTTSCGMKVSDNFEIDLCYLNKNARVYDIIYSPKKTILMEKADSLDLSNNNGIYMLIRQAAESFKKWFGITINKEDINEVKNLLEKND